MISLQTALSGLRANRLALEVIGQNVANANTPGYHRQEIMLAPRPDLERGAILLGTGVDILAIRRIRDAVVEESIQAGLERRGRLDVLLTFTRRLETILAPEEGKINELLDRFFLAFDELSGRPDDMTLRRSVLNQAVALADQFNGISDQLTRFREVVETEIRGTIETINRYAEQLAELNVRIGAAELSGKQANSLRDRRDLLLEKLAELVDIQVIEQDYGRVNILVGGYMLVGEGVASPLSVEFEGLAQTTVRMQGIPGAVQVTAGKLAGLIELHDSVFADIRQRLDLLATTVMAQVDGLHATGLGLNGSYTRLTSVRPVSDSTVPLSQAVGAFPVQAGDLYITVTDTATGQRALHRVAIDPATMSLQDLAAAITALPNVTAVVNAATNTIAIAAVPGYRFDFTGRMPAVPDHSGVSGTARFTVDGVYTGQNNDTLTVTVVGSGEVGVTDGLLLRVTNGAGEVLGEFNVGAGYAPGDELSLGQGIVLSVGPGTLNDGDVITLDVVGRPDETGVLAALGLNSLFRGSGAGDIKVRPELVADPASLAAGRTGEPGDGLLARQLGTLREQLTMAGGTLSMSGYFLTLLTDIGATVSELDGQLTHEQLLLEQLEFERQSASGVDIEEEVIRMSQYQRAFEASAQLVRVVNDALDELMNVL